MATESETPVIRDTISVGITKGNLKIDAVVARDLTKLLDKKLPIYTASYRSGAEVKEELHFCLSSPPPKSGEASKLLKLTACMLHEALIADEDIGTVEVVCFSKPHTPRYSFLVE